MVEYRRTSHTVHRLRYHFVFITKYRKPVLRGDIAKEIRDLVREICRTHDIEIVRGHVRPDHVVIGAHQLVAIGLDQRSSAPLVISVVDGSPADRAGVQAGDIIASVDGIETGTDEL